MLYKTRGIVFRFVKYGETSIIVTIFTELFGLQSYIVNEEGKMEAEEGCFDDCVMALAMANHGHAGLPKPVKIEDDYYEDAL